MHKFLILLLSASTLIAGTSSGGDAPPPSEAAKKPQEIVVALYLLNVGKYDISNGEFLADFYLDFKHDIGVDPTGFEFINGRAKSSELILSTPTEHFYRIQASLYSSPDLHDYPFDTQTLSIIIEDKRYTMQKQLYVPLLAESHLDDSIVFPGWDITNWTAGTEVHKYDNWNEEFSQFIFSIEITRTKISSFIKNFVPVFFLLWCAMVSFVVDFKSADKRIMMSGTTLAATVIFHVSLTQKIPPVGYFTFLDKFMLLTYAFMIAIFIVNIVIVSFSQIKLIHKIEKFNLISELTFLALILITYPLLFWIQ